MKRCFSSLLCIVLILLCFTVDISAVNEETFVPYVVNLVVTTDFDEETIHSNDTRATGLIYSYSLYLTKTGTTLNITGQTHGTIDVVKTGFKDLTIQRRKTSDDSWKDYYEYGNLYAEAVAANLNTTLVVESGYQYRISCKHYAKKNLLSVQTIANTSGIVTVS